MEDYAYLICGGGARAPIQLGYIVALDELGFRPKVVYAGSAGALNALLWLQGDVKALTNLWLNIKNSDVYSFNPLTHLTSILSNKASIYDSKPLENLIRRFLNMDKIKNLPFPFIVNVTNITTMESESKDIRTLDYESAVKWILASASPPILFPLVKIGEYLYSDCGILNNYFIAQAINDGYDNLICMTPTNYKSKPISNILDIVQATISTSSFGYLDRERKAVEKINKLVDQANIELEHDLRKINLTLIRPDHPWDIGLIDFNYKIDRQQLIDYGYKTAMKALKPLASRTVINH